MRRDNSKRNKVLVTVFMASIMVSSIFGFIMLNSSTVTNDLSYNEFSIIEGIFGYQVFLDEEKSVDIVFHPTSLELEEIPPEVWLLLDSARVLGVTYESNSSARQEFGAMQFLMERNLVHKPLFVQRGLTNASGTALSSMSCADARPDFPVVFLTIGPSPKISIRDSCVVMQGQVSNDVVRFVDRITLGLVGVMPRG